jgi:hypothetical protein
LLYLNGEGKEHDYHSAEANPQTEYSITEPDTESSAQCESAYKDHPANEAQVFTFSNVEQSWLVAFVAGLGIGWMCGLAMAMKRYR